MLFTIALSLIILAFLFFFGQVTRAFDLLLLFSIYMVGYSVNEINKYAVAVAGLIAYALFAVTYNLSFLSFVGSIFFYCWFLLLLGMFSPIIELKLNEIKNKKQA